MQDHPPWPLLQPCRHKSQTSQRKIITASEITATQEYPQRKKDKWKLLQLLKEQYDDQAPSKFCNINHRIREHFLLNGHNDSFIVLRLTVDDLTVSPLKTINVTEARSKCNMNPSVLGKKITTLSWCLHYKTSLDRVILSSPKLKITWISYLPWILWFLFSEAMLDFTFFSWKVAGLLPHIYNKVNLVSVTEAHNTFWLKIIIHLCSQFKSLYH